MAAGRVDVLRKRDFGGDRRRDSDYQHHNNRSRCGVESYQGPDRASRTDVFRGNRLSSSKGQGLDSESCRGKGKVYDGAQVKNGKALKYADVHGVQAPPEKKRKFSPITWDMGDKGARSTSKNCDLPAGTAQTSAPQVLANASMGSNTTKQHAFTSQLKQLEVSSVMMVETVVSKSSVVKSSSLLMAEFHGSDDEEQGEVKGEGFGKSRNIESSRWASDSSSPSDIVLSDDEDTPKEERSRNSSSSRTIGDTRSSTPESGEICRDGSGTDLTRLSVERVTTREDECSEDELLDGDLMDTDKTDSKSPVGGQVESKIEETMVPSHRNFNMLNSCRSVSEFEKLNKISEGSYGIVYRARDKTTDEIVALKKVKIKMDRDYLEYGFPLSALREINILLSFNHPSIVDVKEVVMGSDLDSVFVVMEYIENDLKGLMDKMKQKKLPRFSTSEVKCLMRQLLEGVKYLHDNWVLHRDLKTANLLFNNKGQMKICDFGISRQYGSPIKPYTPLVVTLHYRSPELLLGAKWYSTAVDMWSVGCIMAELLGNEPLFHGKTEADQLQKIFKVIGTPNETIWPGFTLLPGAKAIFANQPYNQLRGKFPATSFTGSPVLSNSGLELLKKLLAYDPKKRITAEDALKHEWFSEVPLPKDTEFMPTFPPQHVKR